MLQQKKKSQMFGNYCDSNDFSNEYVSYYNLKIAICLIRKYLTLSLQSFSFAWCSAKVWSNSTVKAVIFCQKLRFSFKVRSKARQCTFVYSYFKISCILAFNEKKKKKRMVSSINIQKHTKCCNQEHTHTTLCEHSKNDDKLRVAIPESLSCSLPSSSSSSSLSLSARLHQHSTCNKKFTTSRFWWTMSN